MKEIIAKFIGVTYTRGGKKFRWECPRCRDDDHQPECRFNLSPKRKIHKCRFCGVELKLIK